MATIALPVSRRRQRIDFRRASAPLKGRTDDPLGHPDDDARPIDATCPLILIETYDYRFFALVAIGQGKHARLGAGMKKIMLIGVGIAGAALMAIVPGNAADLGVRPALQPATVPVRLFSWTGCYAGGNIGWGWGRETVSIPNLGETTGVPALAGVSLGPVTGDTKGFLGGGQVGCNFQFAPNWVIGFEGDGEAAKIKGDVTETVSLTNPVPVTGTGTASAQTDWIAGATGRLGWTWDRAMLYAKGGAAWAGDIRVLSMLVDRLNGRTTQSERDRDE